jgi:hypothetical protein
MMLIAHHLVREEDCYPPDTLRMTWITVVVMVGEEGIQVVYRERTVPQGRKVVDGHIKSGVDHFAWPSCLHISSKLELGFSLDIGIFQYNILPYIMAQVIF